MEVQQNAIGNLDNYPLISKEQALKAFESQLDINLEQMDEMLNDPKMKDQPTSEAEQEEMMNKIVVNKAKTDDMLFEKTGIETEQLNAAIQKHNLQFDAQFMKLATDNMMKVKKKTEEAGIEGPLFNM